MINSWEASLNAPNVENFQQWKSAIYAQIVEKYLTNDSCYICTKCGECLPFTNTCMCNKCGKIFKCQKTIWSILQDMHSQIEAILKSIKQQLAAIYALNVKDDLKMWSSDIYAQNVEKLSPRGSSYMLWIKPNRKCLYKCTECG